MCGICGLLGPDAPDRALVEAMNDAIVHRGPDHGAVASYGRCVLGYRRLAIVDLVTGDQPVENESGEVAAVFNGEIYNFRELRARARGEGPRDPRHRRLAADPPRLRGVGPRLRPAARGDVRDRALGPPRRAASCSPATGSGKKPLALRPPPRRLARVRLGDEGAAAAALAAARARPGAARRVPRAPVRSALGAPRGARRCRRARWRSAEGGAVRVMRYWRPAPAEERGRLDRARARGGHRGRAQAPRGGRPARRAALGRASTRRSSSRRWRRRHRSRSGRSRSAFPTARYDERAYARAVAERYRHHARGARGRSGAGAARPRRGGLRRAVRRRGGAADAARLRGDPPPRHRRARRRRRRRGLRRLRALPGARARGAGAAVRRVARQRRARRRPRRPARAALDASSGPGASSTSPRSRPPSATPASSRCSRSSSAASSGRTRRGRTRRGRCSRTTPTCGSSTWSRTFPATCCRRATSPRWPSRSSCARRSSITA